MSLQLRPHEALQRRQPITVQRNARQHQSGAEAWSRTNSGLEQRVRLELQSRWSRCGLQWSGSVWVWQVCVWAEPAGRGVREVLRDRRILLPVRRRPGVWRWGAHCTKNHKPVAFMKDLCDTLCVSVCLREGCVCVRTVCVPGRLDGWQLRLSRLHGNLPVSWRLAVQRAGQMCVWQMRVWRLSALRRLLRAMPHLPEHLPIILVRINFCAPPQSMMGAVTEQLGAESLSVCLSGGVWTATCLTVSRKKREGTATTPALHWWATRMMYQVRPV